MAKLEELVNSHGLGVKCRFDVWPKGKYFIPEKKLASGDFAGTLYGCPDQDMEPTSVIKTADQAKKWKSLETKSMFLAPAILVDDDGDYSLSGKLYSTVQEAREDLEDDGDGFKVVDLSAGKNVSVEVY